MDQQMPTLAEIVEQHSIASSKATSIVHTMAEQCRAFQAQLNNAIIIINEKDKIIELYNEKYGIIERPSDKDAAGKTVPFKKGGENDKKTN